MTLPHIFVGNLTKSQKHDKLKKEQIKDMNATRVTESCVMYEKEEENMTTWVCPQSYL